MFKVYLTNAVVSKGYDKNPALNFSENGMIRFLVKRLANVRVMVTGKRQR